MCDRRWQIFPSVCVHPSFGHLFLLCVNFKYDTNASEKMRYFKIKFMIRCDAMNQETQSMKTRKTKTAITPTPAVNETDRKRNRRKNINSNSPSFNRQYLHFAAHKSTTKDGERMSEDDGAQRRIFFYPFVYWIYLDDDAITIANKRSETKRCEKKQ